MAVRSYAWDDPNVLEANRQRLLKDMRKRMYQYEARYELSSERLEAELAEGRIRETDEVSDWIITFHTYRALRRA